MRFAAVQRFWRDEGGAAIYALALGLLFAAVATIALAFDVGRAYVEHTRMQGYVDSLSLAAAAELDGKPDAINRAAAAVAAGGLGRDAGFSAPAALDDDGASVPADGGFAILAPLFLSSGPTLTGDPNVDAATIDALMTSDPAKATHVLIRAKPRADSWSLSALLTTAERDEDSADAGAQGRFDLSAWSIASSRRRSDSDVELTFAIDNSASMLFGATPDDLDAIGAINQRAGCGFACHRGGGASYRKVRELGIDTRLDVARAALERSVATVRANPPQGDAEVYFDVLTWALDLIPIAAGPHSEMPPNFEAIQPEPGPIGGPVPYMTDPRRTFPDLLARMTAKMEAFPDRRHILVLMTDGVADYDRNRGSDLKRSRVVRAITREECELLKSAGSEIAVIYTTYFPTPENATWRATVRRIEQEIEPSLRACATEGLFFEAGFKDEIDAAFRAITDLRGFVDNVTLTD
ncbi:MAG: Tad domain-containing protein [Pseudomonadota bacterium]